MVFHKIAHNTRGNCLHEYLNIFVFNIQTTERLFLNVYFINKRRFGDLLHLQVVGLQIEFKLTCACINVKLRPLFARAKLRKHINYVHVSD